MTFFASSAMAQGGSQVGPEEGPSAVPFDQFDPRTRVDIGQGPWRSVGKVQATAGGLRLTCTGALVGPQTVLTAAHCLFNVRTGRNFLPSSLHFLIGFEGQKYVAAAGIVSVIVGPGYDPTDSGNTRGSDWALLMIDAPLGTADRVLPISPGQPPVRTAVMIGGYAQDNPNVMTADTGCRILGYAVDGHGRRLLRHDCSATHGVSGAPVLVKGDAGWSICGVNVARSKTEPVGVAVLATEAGKRL